MDGTVCERRCERVVDQAVLVDEGQPFEARARHGYLEVIAAACAVDYVEFGGVGKRLREECLERFCCHGFDRNLRASLRD